MPSPQWTGGVIGAILPPEFAGAVFTAFVVNRFNITLPLKILGGIVVGIVKFIKVYMQGSVEGGTTAATSTLITRTILVYLVRRRNGMDYLGMIIAGIIGSVSLISILGVRCLTMGAALMILS